MKQINVCAGGGETCYQGVLKHVAASSGILSDGYAAAALRIVCSLFRALSVIPAQETAYLVGMLYR